MIDLLTQPSCDDIAWQWVITLFGVDGTGCTIHGLGATAKPFAAAFQVFSAVLAFLGSLFMTYHVAAGIVSTAYTGKVLGERWHQIWAPLRIVLGFGLLVPVMGGGFSAVHFILRDIVGVSAINLANAIIVTYSVTAATEGEKAVAASVSVLQGEDLAKAVFSKEVCTGLIPQMASTIFTSWDYKATSPKPAQEAYGSIPGMPTGYAWSWQDCGSLTLQDVGIDANSGLLGTDNAKQLYKTFNKKRYDATRELITKVQAATMMDYAGYGKFIMKRSETVEKPSAPIIKALKDTAIVKADIRAELKAAGEAWNKAVSEAATEVFKTLSTDAKNALNPTSGEKSGVASYGFMMAGAYERTLSGISSVVSGFSNQAPVVGGVDFDEEAGGKYALAMKIISSGNMSSTEDNIKANGAPAPDDNVDIATSMIGTLFSPSLANMAVGQESDDPVGDMIQFGNNLLTIASAAIITIIVTGTALTAVDKAVGGSLLGFAGAGGISSIPLTAFELATKWFGWTIMIMMGIGLMHSFVLPMIPMIMVFTMGMSWLVMFLEASIAGVLWAFVFIRMDGTEFFDQKQSPGVGLLFNLLLRPALGMLAFCGLLLLLPVMLNTLNKVWGVAFALQTGNHASFSGSLVWIWQKIAGMVMFCWMQWHMTLRITGLIPNIADRVGGWMGINSQSGYNDSSEHHSTATAAVASVAALKQIPIGTGGGGRGRPPGGGGGGGGGGGDPSTKHPPDDRRGRPQKAPRTK
jgi:conjugal transfer/type IV secretion protein DotA/TraY